MKSSKQIKQEILDMVVDYYNATQNEKEITVLGKNKINYAGRVYNHEELINLVDSSLDFWLTSGRFTKEFEKKLSEFIEVAYCHFVNSGSSANLLAFSALTSPLLKERQVKKGDEVITIAYGFPTTISPIIQYNCVPVFIDIKNDNIDEDKIKNALSPKTKVIMVAHTLGNPFNIEKVSKICKDNNLWFISDECP